MTEKQAYWSTHLAAMERLGVTGAEYARREGLSTKALYRWRARLKAAPVATPSSSAFIALRVPALKSQSTLDPACVLALAPDLRLELAGLPARSGSWASCGRYSGPPSDASGFYDGRRLPVP